MVKFLTNEEIIENDKRSFAKTKARYTTFIVFLAGLLGFVLGFMTGMFTTK